LPSDLRTLKHIKFLPPNKQPWSSAALLPGQFIHPSVSNCKIHNCNTMAGFEILPNELIGLVFASAPDLHTALSLSATNHWLRGVWLEGAERYTLQIRISNIIAYEQAVDLAIAEERLEGQLGHLGHSAALTANSPIQYYAARLLRNDELAKSAAAAFYTWLDNQRPSSYRRQLSFDCPHTAYYMLRKLVLAYRYPQAGFQSSLLEALRTSTTVTHQTNSELALFLGGQADEEERVKHGMSMPREDWPMEEEYADSVNLLEWDYAGEVVHCAHVDQVFGLGKLEPAMNSVFS
jgi:hypothetical protein